jgi:hypothetical protein
MAMVRISNDLGSGIRKSGRAALSRVVIGGCRIFFRATLRMQCIGEPVVFDFFLHAMMMSPGLRRRKSARIILSGGIG